MLDHMKNNMFVPGTKVLIILYQGTDPAEAEQMLNSYKHLIKTSPFTTKGPGVDVEVKINEILFEQTEELFDKVDTYTVIGKGVVI